MLCKNCGKNFEKVHTASKYCSIKCRLPRLNKGGTKDPKVCAICKKNFASPSPRAKTCSKFCRLEYQKVYRETWRTSPTGAQRIQAYRADYKKPSKESR